MRLKEHYKNGGTKHHIDPADMAFILPSCLSTRQMFAAASFLPFITHVWGPPLFMTVTAVASHMPRTSRIQGREIRVMDAPADSQAAPTPAA